MKKRTPTTLFLSILCIFISLHSVAQINLAAQLRTRTELRDGQGSPLPKGAKPSFFTSQRTRLSLGYSAYRLKLNVTAQDVRVWGQDVSTINRTTTQDLNGLMFHEAWAEIRLNDTTIKTKTLALKLGRQELVYDDQRLLGNLDWLQQGRRHDAALLKYEWKTWMLHLGGAFNQNKEAASGSAYYSTPAGNYAATTNAGSMYKSMAFLYAGKKISNGNASFLFFTDHFSKYYTDTVTHLKVFDNSAWTRATTGFYFNNSFGKLQLTASAYYQFGHNYTGQKISATLLTAATQYTFAKKINSGVGVDYYSGGTSGSKSKAFDPLYGTPHKFAGLMDYYYAANGFGRNGLIDSYLKSKYRASDKFSLGLDLHQFTSAARVTGYSTRNLGQEIDLVSNYSLTKQIGFEAGYAHYFVTELLTSPTVKNVPNARSSADWAYVMINVKPDFLFK
ncbi:MAG: alginate export family protein [Flavisolibacter sp.]